MLGQPAEVGNRLLGFEQVSKVTGEASRRNVNSSARRLQPLPDPETKMPFRLN
jgi:hypothetical protein